MKFTPHTFIVLLLAGCSTGSTAYIKPGTPPEKAAADAGSCRAEARRVVRENMRPEINAASDRGLLGDERQRDMLAFDERKRTQRVTDDCMRSLGYTAR